MLHYSEKPTYYDGSGKDSLSSKQLVNSKQTIVTPVSAEVLIKFPCFPYLK
ncbi:hypothetical protein [Rossellomorea vietnamensis]|uniref:hypothetical protein n=1 Tax=Rossellomorea vietnamensis TaxID=218284 RepID=UPI001653551D|nr:hypothetical protein [Rossellomorea vietnamensis]